MGQSRKLKSERPSSVKIQSIHQSSLIFNTLGVKETQYSIQKGEYNYIWMVLTDNDFDDLVTNIQIVSQILMEQGFGVQAEGSDE